MTDEVVRCWCENGEERGGPVGERSLGEPLRHARCYLLAYRYAASRSDDSEVHLVHGTILGQEGGKLIRTPHAWVVESDGWVWEPTNNAWLHNEEAFADGQLQAQPVDRWGAADAQALVRDGKRIGDWSSEGWDLEPPPVT